MTKLVTRQKMLNSFTDHEAKNEKKTNTKRQISRNGRPMPKNRIK